MNPDHRVKCPTCMVPRGVACRAVRVTEQTAIAVWMLGGSRAKVATHRARKVSASKATR